MASQPNCGMVRPGLYSTKNNRILILRTNHLSCSRSSWFLWSKIQSTCLWGAFVNGCKAVNFLLFCTLALGRMVLCVCAVFTSLLFFSLAKSSYPYFQLRLSVRALCPRGAHYCLQNSTPDSDRAWLPSMTTITLKTASWCLRCLQHLT